MVANDVLKVGNLAELGINASNCVSAPLASMNPMKLTPVLAEGLHFFNGAQRTLISSITKVGSSIDRCGSS